MRLKDYVTILHMKYLYLIILFFITLVLYALTLSPTISLQGDSGELATAVLNLGIPHPPGYPTYILLAKFFTTFFSAHHFTFALNFFSMVASLFSGVLLFLILAKLTKMNFLAFIMTLFFATSLEFWFHSEIIEVYTLNIFFILLVIYLLLNKTKKYFSFGLILGLGIGVHYFFLVLIPLFIIYLIKITEKKSKLTLVLIGFLFGLASFSYIPLRAGKFAPLNTFNVNSLERMTKLVTFPFNGYPKVKKIKPINLDKPIVKSPINKFKRRALEKIQMGEAYARELFAQFFLLPYLTLFILLLLIFKKWLPTKPQWIFLLLFSYTSLGFLYFTGFKANSSLESEMTPQYITSYLFFTVFLTLILSDLFKRYSTGLSRVTLFALTLMLIFQIKNNYSLNNMSNNDLAERHGRDLLSSAPLNAILLVKGDNDYQTLLYFQQVLKERRDITLVNIAAIKQPWYYENLMAEHPELNYPAFDPNFLLGELLLINRDTHPLLIANFHNLAELKDRSAPTTWNEFATSFYPYKALYHYFLTGESYEAILPTLYNSKFTTPFYESTLNLRKREQTVVTNYLFKKYFFGKQLHANGKTAEAQAEFSEAKKYPRLDLEFNQTLRIQLLKEQPL